MSRGTNMYHVLRTCKKWHHVKAMTFVPRACFFVHVHKKFAYSCANCAFLIFNNLKKEWSISVTHVQLKKMEKKIQVRMHGVFVSFIFYWYMKSLHYIRIKKGIMLTTSPCAEKIYYIRVRTVCRLLLLMSRYNNKFSELT